MTPEQGPMSKHPQVTLHKVYLSFDYEIYRIQTKVFYETPKQFRSAPGVNAAIVWKGEDGNPKWPNGDGWSRTIEGAKTLAKKRLDNALSSAEAAIGIAEDDLALFDRSF